MTVTNETSRVDYTGDDATTAFPVTFPFFEETDLLITERVIATGAESTKVLGVDYTVTITSPNNLPSVGTVNATEAPAATVEWIIERITDGTQESDYVNAAAFQPETSERDFDRAALRDIDQRRDLQRALLVPRTDDPAVSAVIPSTVERASKHLGFDASGVPVALDSPAGTTSLSVFGAALGLSADAAAARDLLLTERIDADLIGNRPAASTFGVGFFYATDLDQLYYSDASTWSLPIGPGQFANGSLPAAATAGRLYLDTDNLILKRDSGAALQDIRAPLPRGHIAGLGLSLSGSDQDVNIAVGECRVGTNAIPSQANAYLTAALVKQCDADWSEGTNQGGKPAALSVGPAGQWWSVFVLHAPDGRVDGGIDKNATGSGLLADSAVQAAGYTLVRRIGAVKETAAGDGTMTPFIQFGDHFVWETYRNRDVSLTGLTDTDTLVSLDDVPGGIRTLAHISAQSDNLTLAAIFAHGGVTIGATPAVAGDPLGNVTNTARYERWLLTDTNNPARVRYRGDDAAHDLYVTVMGYVDYRDRWA